MEFTERLKRTIKATGLNVDLFAQRVGISRAQVYNYLKGGNEPTATFFQEIKKQFPWVSIEWLVADVGEMGKPAGDINQSINGNGNVMAGGKIVIGQRAKVGMAKETSPDEKEPELVGIGIIQDCLEAHLSPQIRDIIINEIRNKMAE